MDGPARRGGTLSRRLRPAGAIAVVLAACAVGGMLAVWSYSDTSKLSVGRIALSVSPFHHGALDAYVPLVDWGVRFDGVRAPARLQVQLETIDRATVESVATTGRSAAGAVRGEVRDAIAGFLRRLALLPGAGALALGSLAAGALRGPRPRLRFRLAVAALGAAAWMVAVAVLLAPRGPLDKPVYYAHGSDIPVALRAVEAASQAPGRLGAEVDDQLVGLARLVTTPGRRPALTRLPRLTVASDLHNNVVAIGMIRRAAAGGPVVFAGDLSDRGSPLETSALRSVLGTGRPFVFVAGNHDSDRSSRQLARAGAIVLTRRGRLLPGGRYGPLISSVRGVRMAGYESPNLRRAAQDYRDRGADVTPADQAAFTAWLMPLVGRVDVVVVHEAALAEPAIEELRKTVPAQPLLVVEGHTHRQAVVSRAGVIQVNGGTVGAGGTGNLDDGQPIGLAVVTYRAPQPGAFDPLAVDLVQVAPGTGEGSARRIRLDQGPVTVGDALAASPEPASAR